MKIKGQIIPFVASQRKQPTFVDATTGSPQNDLAGSGSVAKCRLFVRLLCGQQIQIDKIDRKHYENNIKKYKGTC